MTRISSYTLYQCQSCDQIHIKNEYGSVTIYVPTDLYLNPTEIRPCKKCGAENQVKEYINLGVRPKVIILKVSKIKNLNFLIKWIMSGFKFSKEVDLSEIYPYL
jgi:uncharacterized UBP type Zn finger protein